ncbi:hypothetical protein ACFOD4_17535 [Pseudoroseomonas globiformis]|uniref:Uncharacterized protein n=1 Tax=Teichococcus globiformis TaxID=2307229 RepID=A0ABV7G5B5_9PROT
MTPRLSLAIVARKKGGQPPARTGGPGFGNAVDRAIPDTPRRVNMCSDARAANPLLTGKIGRPSGHLRCCCAPPARLLLPRRESGGGMLPARCAGLLPHRKPGQYPERHP